jgi:3-oxoadipate enol-lactonase
MSATKVFFRDVGTGEPLLLVHGLMVSGAMFDPLLPLLAARRVIVPDLRGHGNSQHLPPPYTPQQHARDLAELLDDRGIAQTDVLGYSQGGATAQQFAHDYPERVRRLILVCTYAHNMLTWRERIEGALMPALVRLLGVESVARLMAENAGELTAEQAEHLRAMIAANGKAQALASIHALQTFDSRGWLRELRCPTLIIAGAQDRAVPLHHAYLLRNSIPNATLDIIQGAGHTLLWTHSAELVASIETFWRENQ